MNLNSLLPLSFLLGLACAGSLAMPASAQKQAPESVLQEAAWRSTPAWQDFVQKYSSAWQVEWHPATSSPKALWGKGVPIADWRENSIQEARRHAHQLLQDHAALLRTAGSEFRETIGARMHKTWTFTFQQYHQGLEVIGGRADVRVNMVGRVPMFGATAWQIPAAFETTPAITGGTAWLIAWQKMGAVPTGAPQPAEIPEPRLVIWGDIDATSPASVHLAWEVAVSNVDAEGRGPIGRYYVDARKGEILDFVNDKHECGLATCNFSGHKANPKDVVMPAIVAGPAPAHDGSALVATTVTVMAWTRTGVDAFDPLVNTPMPGLVLSVPGIGNVTTDDNGQFTVDIAAATTITVGALDGRHHNPISGANAPSGSFQIQPGVPNTIQLLNSASTTNEGAHTTTSYWVDRTNQWSRSILGNTTQLNTASGMAVTVNIASTCNAYYTGNTINFYQAGGGCSNTAFSTVVAHEWGHGLDDRYGGISQTDGLSEGWGDILGCYLLDTPNLGSGFQTAGVPLRSGNNTTQYPCSGCGVHTAGQSWMGFAWKLRNKLATTFGNRAQAIALTNDIVVSTIAANALNQRDAVREVFIADDNDGDLTNQTPNWNDLVWACNQHSLPVPGQPSTVPNDECSGAIALGNGLSASYSTVGAFTSSPAWPCASGGSDSWFTYTATGTGSMSVSLCSQATWDTALQVFSGACTGLTSLGCNDDTCSLQSTVTVNVTQGTTYRIRVGGYAGAVGSFRLNITGPANPPAAPSGLSATAVSTSQIDLAWTDNATDETGYVVQRSTDGTTFATAATLGANVIGWSDTGRDGATTYWYRVAATGSGGTSAYSNVANATTQTPTAPAAPTNLLATAVSGTQINLTWVDNATDETGFVVQRSLDGTTFTNAATLGVNIVSWNDAGRTSNTTYWYRVQAVNGTVVSAWSNVASDTTPVTVTNFVATGQATNHGTITGSFTLTHNADNSYQQLTERTASGRNSLQYEWLIANVPATGTRTLRVQAYRTVSADNDSFILQVRVGSSYVNAITVTKTVDDNTYQEYVLPSTVSGTVRVRVIDSDNRRNVTGNDSLFVDHLVITAQ